MKLDRIHSGAAETGIAERSAQALAFASGGRKIVLIAVDIMGMSVPRADAIAKAVCAKCGLPADGVMLVCSGAASGPVTCPAYGKAEPDEAVLKELEAKLPDLAAAALKALAPSAVGAYRASLPHIAHTARFLTRNWKAVNEWMGVPPNEVLSPESQADADLHVLVIRGCDGSLYALLWCYSAEDRFGESLSAAVQKEIDLRLGKHIPCLRLPGCGANTAFTYDFGKTADLLASSVVASAMEACCDPTASVGAEKRSVILSPRDYREFYDRAEIELKLPGAVPVFERELELLRKEAPLALPAAAWAFRVGPIVVAGFPGNVFSDFILELKKRSPVKLTCATGFCGATLGYLMPSAAFDNGGFEAWPARWALPARGCGEFLCDELAGMLGRLS